MSAKRAANRKKVVKWLQESGVTRKEARRMTYDDARTVGESRKAGLVRLSAEHRARKRAKRRRLAALAAGAAVLDECLL